MDKAIPQADVRCAMVLTTLPTREAAQALARTLVDERLAACVQLVDGLLSIFRWDGRIDESAECQLIAKTAPPVLPALVERLRALHPYDLPEIVTLDAAASDAYGKWLRDETHG